MRIDILCKPETGPRGEQLLGNVRQALDQMGVDAEVHLYHDRRKLIDNRVYVAPALMVDDSVRVAGRVPEVGEIVTLLADRPHYRRRLAKVA